MRESVGHGEPWTIVDDALLTTAKSRAIEALSDANPVGVGSRLATYYDPEGNYAGATFLGMVPNLPGDIVSADLHAVSMLSIRIGARSTRRFLDEGELRRDVVDALANVPDDVELPDADRDVLAGMEGLYRAVKRAASDGNAWATASMLCARKRPLLFPVLETLIRDHLGLKPHRNHVLNWEVFRELMWDPKIVAGIDAAGPHAIDYGRARGIVITPDTNRLRLLTVALWTHAMEMRSQ